LISGNSATTTFTPRNPNDFAVPRLVASPCITRPTTEFYNIDEFARSPGRPCSSSSHPAATPIVSLYLSSSVAVPMPFDFTATYKSTRQLPSNTQTTRWERWRPGRQVTVHAAVHAARYQLGVQQEPVRLAMYHKKFQVAPGFSCDAHANSLGRLALKFSLFARRQYVLAERDLHRCATFFSRR